MSADKRVVFRSRWLPWLLLAPQLIIIAVFFFWPAGQALVQSLHALRPELDLYVLVDSARDEDADV